MDLNDNNKVPVTFTKPHGRYNRGETAGFAPDVAKRLCAGDKAVAKPYDAAAAKAASEAVESAEVVAARAADLDAREAALAEREAEMAAKLEKSAKDSAGAPPKAGEKAKA